MDGAIALSVVPEIVGPVVLVRWLGLPTLCEAPLAFVLSVAIILGYAPASPVRDGTGIADALVQDVAVGPTLDRFIATIRRFALERRARRS